MVEITLDNIVPSTPPSDGWVVKYRIKGSGGAYTTASYLTFPIVITTTDPAGTLYEGTIQTDCEGVLGDAVDWTTPCDCTEAGYNPAASGEECEMIESISPTVAHSGYCLAACVKSDASLNGTRIYNSNFIPSDINLAPGSTGSHIFTSMNAAPYWANPTSSLLAGPLNRIGVWIDTDCDDLRDAVDESEQLTLSFIYDNLGAEKTIYVGIAANKKFTLLVNGTSIVASPTVNDRTYKIFHIFPVTVASGTNYINVVVEGDGTTGSIIGVIGYDNTPSQISVATSDDTLNILFTSELLRNTEIDVATCAGGYSLDISGGIGNYECKKTLLMACNTAP